MLARAKNIAAVIVQLLSRPMIAMAVSRDERGALLDVGAELIELNQRLDKMEREHEQERGDGRPG